MNLNVENAEQGELNPDVVKSAIITIFSEENLTHEEISVLFISDEEIQAVNKKYLGHDFATDVITFPLHKEFEPIEGEIYISFDTTKQNSKHYGISHNVESLRVVIHGILHLAGYDDSTSELRKRMKAKEDYYLELMGESHTDMPKKEEN